MPAKPPFEPKPRSRRGGNRPVRRGLQLRSAQSARTRARMPCFTWVCESVGYWERQAMTRLIAVAHGRYGESEPLDYWQRVPLGRSIVGDSALNHLLIAPPLHYEAQFVLDSGKVDLLHVVGITQRERDYAKEHGSRS